MLSVATAVSRTARSQRFVNCLGLLLNSSDADILLCPESAAKRACEQGVSPIGRLVFLRRHNSPDAGLEAGASGRMAVKFDRRRYRCHLCVGCSGTDTLAFSTVGWGLGDTISSKYRAGN